MSQQWQPPSRSPGGGGSVRRARELAESQAQARSGIPVPQQRPYAYEQPRVAPGLPSNPRMRPQVAPVSTRNAPPASAPRNPPAPIGVAISKPMQAPQWPLGGTMEGESRNNYQPPTNRGPPPQRPPRPSQVPSILDASRMQDPTQYQYSQDRRDRYEDEDAVSPSIASPNTQSSRPSTLSSVGSIPDFPVPMPPPGIPRRSANLGPPPSARRGASSYYSQASFVSPIPEESPRFKPSHESYASSAAIPTSWGSDSPRYGYDEDDYEDELYDDSPKFRNEPIEEGRESRGSNGDDSDDRGLIRSASFGRRAKPSMITTKSSDRIEPLRPAAIPQQPQQLSKLERMGMPAAAGATLAASNAREGQRETLWPMIGDVKSPLASGTGLLDKSTSSSEETVPQVARALTTNEAAPAYTSNPTDPQANAMLGAYNAASSLQAPAPAAIRTPSPGFSRLSAIRRPPRLDMDAVRDAEARGSLTSLPDLIRRATRLAAMMDRGKRPGSRLALNDFPSETDFAREKEMGITQDEKHKSGLSGMLAAFPPPGVATPVNGGTPTRPVSSWPSPYDPSQPPSRDNPPPKRRRCCGLPCWGFLLIVFILLLIIAAAVVVPLELLVLNKPKTNSRSLSAVQQCENTATTACQNGGSSVIDNGVCACICTNGFTGSTCTSANATGCSTTTLSNSSFSNVTLGASIPRLIEYAQSNFSIPLSESTVLARFNSANLSCASENALVTFDGESVRKGKGSDVVNPSSSAAAATATSNSTPQGRRKGKRGESGTPTSISEAAATSNGILYDSSLPSATPSPTSTPTTTSSSTPSTSTTNPLALFTITEEVLDFARISVLYILQEENLDAAVTAQSALQKFFGLQSFTNFAAANVSVGQGNVVDLLAFGVDLGGGKGKIGGRNGSLVERGVVGVERRGRGRSERLW